MRIEQELWVQETNPESFLWALLCRRGKSRSELHYGYSVCGGFSSLVSVTLSELLVRAGDITSDTGLVDTLVQMSEDIYSF